MEDRWLGESAGELPVCPECFYEVKAPDPVARWPRVLYHAECFEQAAAEGHVEPE